MEPLVRIATLAEVDAIDSLMKQSTREIFPRFYNQRQTESSVQHVSAVDRLLIEDGTYFVAEAGGELVACGGWSRRNKLFAGPTTGENDTALLYPGAQPARVRAMFVRDDWTRRGLGTRILEASEAAAKAEGFQTLDLMATLPGIPLYQHYGFRVVERVDVPLADGEVVAMALMETGIR